MSDQIHSNADNDPIELRIKPSDLGAILSCLLHCKFNGDIRLELSTSPALNGLIKEILSQGRERRLESPWFLDNYSFKISQNEINNLHSAFYGLVSHIRDRSNPDDVNQLLTEALYPYSLDKEL